MSKVIDKKRIKAILLAAGRGKRLNELCNEKNKCMIEISGKPLIEYSLDSISNIPQVSEIVIVVGYQAESIINRYGINYHGKKIKYIIQKEQKGLVHAISCTRDYIAGHDFLLFLGDEIVLGGHYEDMINKFIKDDVFGFCSVVWVEDKTRIERTYSIAQSDENTIYRLVEKPKNPFNNWMGTGNCIFKNDILNYIDQVPIHHLRNEKELPDLIQCAIDDGQTIKSFNLGNNYININSPEELNFIEKNWSDFHQNKNNK